MTQHVPGEPKHEGQWSELETNLLLDVLLDVDEKFRHTNGGIDWCNVSRYLPGRKGKQCQRKYQELRRKGFELPFESSYFSSEY